MVTLKTVTLAAALIAGATSLAMAQNGPATGGQPGCRRRRRKQSDGRRHWDGAVQDDETQDDEKEEGDQTPVISKDIKMS